MHSTSSKESSCSAAISKFSRARCSAWKIEPASPPIVTGREWPICEWRGRSSVLDSVTAIFKAYSTPAHICGSFAHELGVERQASNNALTDVLFRGGSAVRVTKARNARVATIGPIANSAKSLISVSHVRRAIANRTPQRTEAFAQGPCVTLQLKQRAQLAPFRRWEIYSATTQ